jgi:hypothetical protein
MAQSRNTEITNRRKEGEESRQTDKQVVERRQQTADSKAQRTRRREKNIDIKYKV